MSEAPPTTSNPEQTDRSAQSSTSPPENVMYKNRLQEYAQRSAIQFPEYRTVNEGSQHAPMFRSTVLVNGTYYTSPNTFLHRKAAEQDVARVALLDVSQKMKDERCPHISEVIVFCKSILSEYAAKMNLEKPTYKTIQSGGFVPVFTSSLVFNGVTYTGDIGKNKKEAEQLAARAVILSLLDSDSGTLISEIVKSKSKLNATLRKVKDSCNTYNGLMPVGVNSGNGLGIALSKAKETEVVGGTNNMPITAVSEPFLGQPANTPVSQLTSIAAVHLPSHEFRKPKPETPSEAIASPIVFVPPASGQPLGEAIAPPYEASCGRKRSRKNKKAKKKARLDAQLAVSVVPVCQLPPCSVAQ